MPRDTRLRKYSRGRSRSRSPECDKTRNFKSLAHSADVPDKDQRAGHTKISRSRSSSRRRVRSSSRSRRSRSRSPLHRRHEESDKRRKRRRRSRSSSSAATSSSESNSSSSTDSLDGRRNQNHRRRHHHHSHKHKHKNKHKRHDKHKHHHKHKHHRKKHKKQHPRVDPLVKAYEDQVIREIKEWQQQQHQAKEKRGSGDSGCPVDDGPSIPWSSELHNEEQKESTMPKRPPMMPQTKQEYDAEQSVVREVVDPIDGRVRLIKGTGEVLERIVSREEHLQINKQATIGDGLTYQRRWMGGGG